MDVRATRRRARRIAVPVQPVLACNQVDAAIDACAEGIGAGIFLSYQVAHRLAEKLAAYEESIRVPLYVAMPGQAAARASDALVTNSDLAPTIAAFAGVAPPGCDGRSLVAHLLGGPAPARKRVLVEHWRSEAAGAIDLPTFSAVRTGPQDAYPDRLYVEYYEDASAPATATALELYDLTEPQGVLQLVSRHADPARASEIAYLKAKLGALKTCGQAGSLSCAAAEE